ncbi:hypothetical protein [Acinetobacter puyangensis]|uniref:hypothetical protein n=1 Tax=Acinetobacter puyangensis TaxID=1096779 RepID=UPI003A4DC04E
MSKFKLLTSVVAFYKPQNGQKFRCSDNFPHWDTPKGGFLRFQVIVPEGYPQPTFSITHDKFGQDKTWYHNIKDNVIIPVDSEEGGSGESKIYVGTTSDLPSSLDGKQTYAVLVWVSID